MTNLEAHPLARIFPLIIGDEYAELVADIRANGLRQPIVVYERKILDGRNRYLACVEAGVEPATVLYEGADPIGFVMSANLMRRHLTTDQRAAIAAELAEKLAEAAKQRQLAGTSASSEAKGKATEQAAKMVGGVSRATVERAVKRKKDDPGAHELAKKGQKVAKPKKPVAKVKAEAEAASQKRYEQAAAAFVQYGGAYDPNDAATHPVKENSSVWYDQSVVRVTLRNANGVPVAIATLDRFADGSESEWGFPCGYAEAVKPLARAPLAEPAKTTLYCSFCGSSQHEVLQLIAGPSVQICNVCVDLCASIICEGRAAHVRKKEVSAGGDIHGGEHRDAAADLLALQNRLAAAFATGKWDAAQIAEHAQRHASEGYPVGAVKVEKVLAGEHVNYHVRDAIAAALDEMAPYVAA